MLPLRSLPQKSLLACALAFVLAVVWSTASLAAARPTTLEGAKQQIADIKKRLADHQGKAASTQADVRALDRQISGLNAQVNDGERDISKLESGLRSTGAQIAELQARYRQATEASNNRARRMYKSGPTESVAHIFSIKSIVEFVRLQVFWEKSSQLDGKTMINASRLRNQLSERHDDLNKIKSTLTDKEKNVSAQLELIQQTRVDRNTSLLTLNKQITKDKEEIEELEGDSKRLTTSLKASTAISRTTTKGSGAPLGAASVSGFRWPIVGQINSPYGPRGGGFHPGIDIQGSTGQPIYAAKAGTVTGISCGSGYGNCTIIDHGGGVSTLYAHQSQIAVNGGPVSAGQVIGYVGCTGSCTGPHLHFEIRINGETRNPLGFLA